MLAVIAVLDGVGKKMLKSSCPFSNQSLMSLLQKRHLLKPSFLWGSKSSEKGQILVENARRFQ